MAFAYVFYVSGVAIAALVLAKHFEAKYKRRFFFLRTVSKGDIHVRTLYHHGVRLYTEAKERAFIYITKQLPLRARNLSNKASVQLRERVERYTGDIRNSRLLKKSDGISEFFRNVADIERGRGEINDSFDDSSQNE
jgi:predicted RNA-binding protein